MRSRSLALFAISLALVSALPSSSSIQLEKRQTWTNTQVSNGTIKLTFSDDTVKLGTLPVDVIIANLTSLCADEGQCDTGPVSIKGYQLIGTGHDESYSSTEDETVTIAASGSYPTWIHNGLLEVLGAAANSVANCSSVTVKPPLCPEIRGLPGDCPDQDPNSSNSAPPFITNDITVTYPTEDGFCSTFSTIGSAVAAKYN
ncbi:hypothetical protein MMC20_002331 [Loxospora ochrophaea]|nr:hypothetical protein [Loxospora ochrophaea]